LNKAIKIKNRSLKTKCIPSKPVWCVISTDIDTNFYLNRYKFVKNPVKIIV